MRRGQAALEFLVSYGWAILVIMVMVGAIAYFGALNPKEIAPDRCIIGEGFGCEDFILTSWTGASASEVSLVIRNNLGKSVEMTNLEIWCPEACLPGFDDTRVSNPGDNCGMFADGGPDTSPWNRNPKTVSAGEVVYVTCNPGGGGTIRIKEAGSKARIFFEFNYTINNGFPHRVQGEIIADVQEQ